MHMDHIMGLPSLITNIAAESVNEVIHVYGPSGERSFLPASRHPVYDMSWCYIHVRSVSLFV